MNRFRMTQTIASGECQLAGEFFLYFLSSDISKDLGTISTGYRNKLYNTASLRISQITGFSKDGDLWSYHSHFTTVQHFRQWTVTSQ